MPSSLFSAEIILRLPAWIHDSLPEADLILSSPEARMDFVLDLARGNVLHQTGGPFAAAVFDGKSGQLIAAGINLVTATGCSIAHAEIVALTLAQQRLSSFSLVGPGLPECELVTSTEPCAMCLGALPWAGIRQLVCGARDEDARIVGFDEGDKPTDWVRCLERRGITVLRDVRRQAARQILVEYANTGGLIYNGRSLADPDKS